MDTKRKAAGIWLMLAALWMANCAPPKASPTAIKTLPPPLIGVTRAIPASPEILPASTFTPPAHIPIPKSNLVKMADELFASRQIQSIAIPALQIESDVVPVGWRVDFESDLQTGAFEWDDPREQVGWVITSALPDETGNIVLYGHNNIYSKVFENLYEAQAGDVVYLQTQSGQVEYKVRNILLLPILGVSAEQTRNYQQYLKPTADARVTLISCYPPVSNTHRVVVIAKP